MKNWWLMGIQERNGLLCSLSSSGLALNQSSKYTEQRAPSCFVSNVLGARPDCSLISGYLSGASKHCFTSNVNSNCKI